MTTPPRMNAYARHIFICNGRFCDPLRRAESLYHRLTFSLGELGQYDNPDRVKRGLSPCLGVCSGGPIAVVYPEGVWYHHLDEEMLDRIVEEHLKNGRPVEEAIFCRLDSAPEGQESAVRSEKAEERS